MAALIIPLLLLVVAIPLVVMLVRANELFCLRVSGTRVAVLRGRIPQRLLDELGDVFRAAPAEVVLRGMSEGGQARVYADGELCYDFAGCTIGGQNYDTYFSNADNQIINGSGAP